MEEKKTISEKEELFMAMDALKEAFQPDDMAAQTVPVYKARIAFELAVRPQTREDLMARVFADSCDHSAYFLRLLKSFHGQIFDMDDETTGKRLLYLVGTAALELRDEDYHPSATLVTAMNRADREIRRLSLSGQKKMIPVSCVLQVLGKLTQDSDATYPLTGTDTLHDLMDKHPDWPVIVQNPGEADTFTYGTSLSAVEGEVLAICPVCYPVKTHICTSREAFSLSMAQWLARNWHDLTCEPEPVRRLDPEQLMQTMQAKPAFRKRLKDEIRKYDPYWKHCIIVRSV